MVGRGGYCAVAAGAVDAVVEFDGVTVLQPLTRHDKPIANAQLKSAGGAILYQRGAKPHVRGEIDGEGRRPDL